MVVPKCSLDWTVTLIHTVISKSRVIFYHANQASNNKLQNTSSERESGLVSHAAVAFCHLSMSFSLTLSPLSPSHYRTQLYIEDLQPLALFSFLSSNKNYASLEQLWIQPSVLFIPYSLHLFSTVIWRDHLVYNLCFDKSHTYDLNNSYQYVLVICFGG